MSSRFLAGHGGFEESIEGLHASGIDNVRPQEMQRFLLDVILRRYRQGVLPPVIVTCLRRVQSMRMNLLIVIGVATRPVSVGAVSTMLMLLLKHHLSLTRTSGSHMLMTAHSDCEMAILAAEIRPTGPGTARVFQTTTEQTLQLQGV